jgi:AcrR family transcriptional regulator
MAGNSTRERILEVATALLDSAGVERFSLRQVTQQAKVNVAAVNYHFGSKDGLLLEVLAMRQPAVARRRLDLLERCAPGPGKPPLLEQILEAYLRPALELNANADDRHLAALAARLSFESGDFARRLYRDWFQQADQRFLDALRAALPDLPARDLAWRFHLMIGGLVFVNGNPGRLRAIGRGLADAGNVEEALAELVAFSAAGLRAAPVAAAQAADDLREARSAARGLVAH